MKVDKIEKKAVWLNSVSLLTPDIHVNITCSRACLNFLCDRRGNENIAGLDENFETDTMDRLRPVNLIGDLRNDSYYNNADLEPRDIDVTDRWRPSCDSITFCEVL